MREGREKIEASTGYKERERERERESNIIIILLIQ